MNSFGLKNCTFKFRKDSLLTFTNIAKGYLYISRFLFKLLLIVYIFYRRMHFLLDEGSDVPVWYLGVVEKVNKDKTIFASHFIRANRNDSTWIFSEKREFQRLGKEQILVGSINVSYPLSVRCIGCLISKEDTIAINQLMNDC